MLKWILAALICSRAIALTPLEGLLKGDVRDTASRDPLKGLFSKSFSTAESGSSDEERERFEVYRGLLQLSNNLVESCSLERFYTYQDSWSEEAARRSVAATLQYIGLELTSRAVVEYSKIFKLSEDEFGNIVDNLVVNSCSDNISVFSKKLLRNNLKDMWEGSSGFSPPSFKSSPFVTKSNFEKTESFAAKEREFNFALKNFRDFCSYNGDVDNYGMLAPYLRNPFVMSLVYNHLKRQKIAWDAKKEAAVLVSSDDTVQVACEDLLCRRRDEPAFKRIFPRMVGSVDLKDDLELLYCSHFRDVTLKAAGASPTIQKWINGQTIEEGVLLPMNLVAMATGSPDFFLASDSFGGIAEMYSSTIEYRWDEWAKTQTEKLVLDLLYEESLYVDLAEVDPQARAQGDLGLVFDFTLGELDRELEATDKLSAVFHLKFPKSYFAWMRRSYIAATQKSDFKKMEELTKKFETYVEVQLKSKAALFKLKLWNESLSSIIANEFLSRVVGYKGGRFESLSHEEVVVPVKFRFGLFALKYLRDKYKANSLASP